MWSCCGLLVSGQSQWSGRIDIGAGTYGDAVVFKPLPTSPPLADIVILSSFVCAAGEALLYPHPPTHRRGEVKGGRQGVGASSYAGIRLHKLSQIWTIFCRCRYISIVGPNLRLWERCTSMKHDLY